MFLLFLKGLIVGLALAAPAGTIGILCIQRSLQAGFGNGFMTGLGAAVGDAFYTAIAAFSLVAISSFLADHDFWIRKLGGIFLIFIGIKLAVAARYTQRTTLTFEKMPTDAFSSAFLLKVSHPVTILTFLGIFTGLGLGTAHPDHDHAGTVVLAVLVGSLLWWTLLCGVATFMREYITVATNRLINRLAGLILLIFGILTLIF